MGKKFNFKKYQNYNKSWKMLIRFLIYSVVIFFLMYMIFSQKKAPTENTDDAIINEFEIETTEPLLE